MTHVVTVYSDILFILLKGGYPMNINEQSLQQGLVNITVEPYIHILRFYSYHWVDTSAGELLYTY